MIKIKNKKLLFAFLGIATLALPLAAVSCSVTIKPTVSGKISDSIAPRENFAPSLKTESREIADPEAGPNAKKNVNVKIYTNSVAPSLFVESGTLVDDKGVNESFYSGIESAAAVYNEFYRIHKPAKNSLEYAPRSNDKKPTYYTPTSNFLDNYETGYTQRTKGATGANVLVTVGAKNSAAIKAWMWEAKNVDIPIYNDHIADEKDKKAKAVENKRTSEKAAGKTEQQINDAVKEVENTFDKAIKGYQDQIDKINNTIIIAYGFDPSAAEDIQVFKYQKDAGKAIGYKNSENVDRVKETYAIPAGQSIQIDPGSLTGDELHKFIANTVYNVLLDLDTSTTNWKILNKGGTAKNESFVLGVKSIKIIP